MNNTPACNPRIYIRSRCPKLTLAFWTFALIVWFCSLFTGAVPAKAAPPSDTPPASLPDLFCIIVDRSGSMGPGSGNNNLVGPASEKLREFIAGLPQDTTVRMVFFDSTMGSPRRWNELTPDTRKDIGRWIGSEFRPAGQTRLFDTVGSVLEEALAEKDKFNRIGLLVFSDGEDNKSERYRSWAEIERLSAEIVSEHPASFLRLYSLGHTPGVAPGAPWKTEVAPDAADLRKINLEPPPEARFRIIPETAEIGQKVVFVVLPGPGRIESATWVFGDGSSGNGTATEHTFAKAGVFGGSLTVTGSSGTETKPFSVTVADRVPLRASFAWLPRAARIGDTIEFIDESAGIPTESHWFIDGNPVGTGRTFSWLSDRAGSFGAEQYTHTA